MSWEPIATIAKKVQSGEVKAVDMLEKALILMKEKDEYHSMLTNTKSAIVDKAKAKAKDIDERVKNGQKVGRLAGVPYIAKDNFLVSTGVTTAASKILESFEAPYQATVIEKLEAEDALLIGKANLDAFAHGSSTENSYFGPTLNPKDKTRVPGGSSGGSVAAVALDIAPFALGTDTGGSIRLPASFCGVVGYKPTYGLVSRYGVIAMASSTDVIGPISKTVEDTALILDVISGRDICDSTTIERDTNSYTDLKTDLIGKKIGVIKEYFDKSLNDKIKSKINDAIDFYKKAGAEIVEISLPSLKLALACYYIIVPAEISSNLSRYDGQRYGYNTPEAKDIFESYDLARQNGFEQENKRRIMIGTYVLSSGYYDAYYKKAQTVRTKLINEFNEVFKKVDILIGPTAPMTAFKLGENTEDPLKMYLSDIMTVAANLTGVPAISIPAGTVDSMPIGLQLMAPQKQDKFLIAMANIYQRENK